MSNGIGVTTGILNWEFQSNYVERVMDNAAYSAAHPDDTLILAGPARKATWSDPAQAGQGLSTVLAIGMLQQVSFNQTKPTQPMMAIGSGRSFFVSGKAQTQWSMARLFVNGRNLLRVLYHNAIASKLPVSSFDDPAATNELSNFFCNLDSELYYIPFGMAAFFRNKVHDMVGSFYGELFMINSWSVAVTAGQNMIMENVTGLGDRLLPLDVASLAGYGKVPAATVDKVLDFASGSIDPQDTTTMGD